MRKKIICISAVCLLLASCKASEGEVDFDARVILSATEATEILQYTPTVSYEKSYTKSVVRYDSDPIGNDPLIAELYAYNDKTSAEDIYAEFQKKRKLRSDSEEVTEYDAEAFVAYPSINIYKDGYMVVVTAGSGPDEAQKQLLIEAGKIAADNLNEYLKKKIDTE